MTNVIYVYVFTSNAALHKIWAKSYYKVETVVESFFDLTECMKSKTNPKLLTHGDYISDSDCEASFMIEEQISKVTSSISTYSL